VGDVSQADVLEKGLRNIPDSPGKFEMLIDKLKDLIKQAEDCNYCDAVPYLTAIYGKQASLRGATIFNRFLYLDRLGDERLAAFEAGRPWPPADDPVYEEGPVPAAGQEEVNDDPRLDQPCASLLRELNLELRDVQESYAFFVEDKITVTQINRDAAIAPTRESLIAARELAIVDREIANKIRLFMEMRVKDRDWRLTRQEDHDNAGPNGARPGLDSGLDETPETAGSTLELAVATPPRPPATEDDFHRSEAADLTNDSPSEPNP